MVKSRTASNGGKKRANPAEVVRDTFMEIIRLVHVRFYNFIHVTL